MDKDIIWVTFRGRHIPIRKGLKGKLKRKIIEDNIKNEGKTKEKPKTFKGKMDEAKEDFKEGYKKMFAIGEEPTREDDTPIKREPKEDTRPKPKTLKEKWNRLKEEMSDAHNRFFNDDGVEERPSETPKRTNEQRNEENVRPSKEKNWKGEASRKYDETYKKLKETGEKISERESKGYDVDYEGRKIKVTGLGGDDNDKELNDLKAKESGYKKELERVSSGVEKERVNREQPSGRLKTIGEVKQFLIDRGYSEETATKYAQEYIANRKKRK